MIAVLYKRLIQIGKVAGAITFLFGAIYGVWQYVQAQQNRRVAQTLEMFKQYNSPPYTTYRENITLALSANQKALTEAAKSPTELTKAIFLMLDKSPIEKDLLLLLDFFDGVSVCVVSGLCDADTTAKLFSARAAELYVNFYQYIDTRRRSSTTLEFSMGLETIARTYRKPAVAN